MGYPVDRIQLYNQNGVPLPELYPNEVESRVRHEEINGEHTLTIVTKRKLDVGWRALTVDGMGKWREWVVEQADELHDAGINAVGTYRLVWSLQYDLTYTFDDSGDLGHREVGISAAMSGAAAVGAAIAGSKKWTVSERCDVPSIAVGGGVVMIAESAWDRLSKVVAAWGGEIDADITVGATGVTSRKVAFMVHLGKTTPTRRFEWGEDLTSIQRTPDPGPYYCRVVPIGRGTTEYAEGPGGTDPTDDEIEFEWPLSLLDDPQYDPHPHEWIEDPDVVEAFRIADGNGGWEYPTKVVKYDKDDVQLLYEAAMEDLHNHTRPNITYTASVAQFARAGFDAKGVALGDEIQVIDRGFNPEAELRIQERVTSIDIDELDDDRTELTIGQAQESLADTLADMDTSFDDAVKRLSYYTTPAYVRDLIDRLNDEINRSGGYTYLVPGMGQITYDVAVSDPKVGAEATKAVEIRGGSIRIGSRTNSDGSWEWKSVFVNGHIAADLVTAAKITTGTIGSASSGNFWDLDNGRFFIGGSSQIEGSDGTTTYIGDIVDNSIVTVDVMYAANGSNTEPPETGWVTTCPEWREGYYIWQKVVTITTSGNPTESDPVCISGRDGVSVNTATLLLYKRSASTPAVPSSSVTYSFDSGQITGDLSGWTTSIPDGDDPCWATSAVASTRSDTDTILANEWAEPAKVFETGVSGTSTAVVMLYQRAAAKPSKPSGTFTYTFATDELSGGSPGAWTRTIPSGANPCWVTAASASSKDPTDTIAGNEFSDPVKLVENGANNATVYLYQRKASEPSKPTISYRYTFDTKSLVVSGSGSTNGWSATIPSGTDPCWVIAATASSADTYDIIPGSEFSDPVKFVENGVNGISHAIVYLYQRNATEPLKPTNSLTYTFATGELSGTLNNGWQKSIPDGSDPCWVITAAAISKEATDTIAKGEWSDPTKLAEHGANNATVYLYQRSSSTPAKPRVAYRYAFDTKTLSLNSGSNSYGWSTTIPSGTDPCWVVAATAASTDTYDIIEGSEFSDPVKLSENGVNGLNQATIYLYQRKATEPSRPTNSLTYTFATGALTGTINNGWQRTIPTGSDPCWVTSAVAISSAATDALASSEWSAPVKLVEHGANSATVYLYQRKASQPTKPTVSYKYTFDTKSLVVSGSGSANGWTTVIPDGTDPCWVIAATASSADTYDIIPGSEFSDPVKFTENGVDGLNQATVYLYQRKATAPSKPSNGLTYTFATGALTGAINNGWQRTIPTGANPCWVISAVAISSNATDVIASSEWSDPTKLAENGVSGVNTMTVILYKRAATEPTVPTSTVTYTFSTEKLSGSLGGWQRSVPSGTDPCWITSAVASSSSDSDTIASTEWSTVQKFVENGLNQATVYIYKRSSLSAPARQINSLTYTFATGKLSGTFTNDWQQSIPSGSNPCWVCCATAISTAETDTIPASEWSDPVKLAENGLNSATVTLYQRSASQPSKPSVVFSYTFSTGTAEPLGGATSPWVTSMPSGTDPCWAVTATAISYSDTDEISFFEWSEPVKTTENGLNQATVYLYKRTSEKPTGSLAKPSTALTYTFATHRLTYSASSGTTVFNGWSQVIGEGVDPIWVIAATAVSSGESDSIPSTEWSEPVMFSGEKGESGVGVRDVVEQYCILADGTEPSSTTSWSTNQPEWVKGKSIWTRSRIEWTNDTVSYTTPILAKAINSANKKAYGLDEELNAEGTLKRLTNNYRLQSLYRGDNGELLINAQFIRTGTLSAIRIKSNDNNSFWNLDTGEMEMFSKKANLKVGRRASDGTVTSLIELGNGMEYSTEYGRVFKLGTTGSTYREQVRSTGEWVDVKSGYLDVTNSYGQSGLHLRAQEDPEYGNGEITSDGGLLIHGGVWFKPDNVTHAYDHYIQLNPSGTSGVITVVNGYSSSSDVRLKNHVDVLGDDACDFVRKLRPVRFRWKDGGRDHLGFYAQDVMEADQWDSETVREGIDVDGSLGFDPYVLDYQALIAPLVAYTQSLEGRIEDLEQRLAAIEHTE